MSRMAIRMLDMLNAVVTGDLKTDHPTKIVEPIKKLVKGVRKHGMLFIYSDGAHLEIDF